MIKLISQKAASKLINQAYELHRAHPQLRVGQNLWNYVNADFPDLAAMHHGTENDFFYQTTPHLAIECFLKHYVEK